MRRGVPAPPNTIRVPQQKLILRSTFPREAFTRSRNPRPKAPQRECYKLATALALTTFIRALCSKLMDDFCGLFIGELTGSPISWLCLNLNVPRNERGPPDWRRFDHYNPEGGSCDLLRNQDKTSRSLKA